MWEGKGGGVKSWLRGIYFLRKGARHCVNRGKGTGNKAENGHSIQMSLRFCGKAPGDVRGRWVSPLRPALKPCDALVTGWFNVLACGTKNLMNNFSPDSEERITDFSLTRFPFNNEVAVAALLCFSLEE